MSLWFWVVLACALAYLTKLVGYLVPQKWARGPRVMAYTDAMTVGLLSSLVLLNTVADGQRLVLDARVVALLVAGLALWRKLPYLVVVLLGALAAAAWRAVALVISRSA